MQILPNEAAAKSSAVAASVWLLVLICIDSSRGTDYTTLFDNKGIEYSQEIIGEKSGGPLGGAELIALYLD